ncbi:MAG TPA: HAMP domain-containing sensor histidine kinase [Acidimicrobiia bacterium]|nr:HAMP domain-containing sensor histidine kinase [Acidimicrobiia bacterium]
MSRLGFRSRLVVTVLAMVVLVTVALGVASWMLVRGSLRSDLVDSATEQSGFVVGVLAPERFDDDPTAEEIAASPFLTDVRLGPDDGLLVDLEGTADFSSGFAFAGPPPPDLAALVAEGQLAYEWVDIGGTPYLAVGGSYPGGPPIYLYYSAASVEETLGDLLTAEVVAGLVVVALAGLGVGTLARRVLTPVGAAADAATRIASGDLSARLDEGPDDDLGRMVAAFNRMAASLEETMSRLQRSVEAQRRFVADVSHELRTPLTALVNETALLADHAEDLPPGDRRLVELLTADVARMRLLVDDLLEISRIDASATDPTPPLIPSIDLRNLVAGVVEDRSPGADLRLPAEPVTVSVDAVTFDRILGNLLDNAGRHGRRPVEVSLSSAEGVARVTVADSGPGVPPDQLERIFDRFAKLDPSRTGSGTGLGLSIARDHARRLGGDVVARPGIEGGLAVEVSLPVARSLPDSDAAVTESLQHGGISREE